MAVLNICTLFLRWGTLKWKYLNGSTPIIGSDGSLYFNSGENLYALMDKTLPKVSITTPSDLKTGVSRTAILTIKFSEYIKASTYYNNITVKNIITNKYVSITKAISLSTLFIRTTATRSPYTWYRVTIPAKAIKDYAGNNLATTYIFRFKTGG